MTRTPRPVVRLSLAAALAGTALLVSACSGGGGGSQGDSSASSAGGSAAMSEAGSEAAGAADKSQPGDNALVQTKAIEAAVAPQDTRAVVSTGFVKVASKDVADARDDARALVLARKGYLADEQTRSDTNGRVTRSDLTLRMPSSAFDASMGDLSKLGRLVSAKRSAEDVTTEVIDVRQRIRAQEVGLQRLEELMSRAGSLGNLLAVEKEVTDRQAELDSLKARQTYLEDQTSLSTIHLTVVRKAPPPVVHHAGFVGGLENGWAALVAVVRAILVTLGAALPFAVIALVLWFPARLVVRRLRTAPKGPSPAAPAEG